MDIDAVWRGTGGQAGVEGVLIVLTEGYCSKNNPASRIRTRAIAVLQKEDLSSIECLRLPSALFKNP